MKFCTKNVKKQSNNTSSSWLNRLGFCPPFWSIFTSVAVSQRFTFWSKKVFKVYTQQKSQTKLNEKANKRKQWCRFLIVLRNNFVRLNSVCSRTLQPHVLFDQVNYCYNCSCCCFFVHKWNVSSWRVLFPNVNVCCVCEFPTMCAATLCVRNRKWWVELWNAYDCKSLNERKTTIDIVCCLWYTTKTTTMAKATTTIGSASR